MRLFSLLVFALLGSSALADFSGVWSGMGSLYDGKGTRFACNDITYEIAQDHRMMTIRYGYLNCPPHSVTIRPYMLEIHAGHLVYAGRTVGTITEDSIDMDFINTAGMREIVHFYFVGDKIRYTDQSIDPRGNVEWLIQGDLSKR